MTKLCIRKDIFASAYNFDVTRLNSKYNTYQGYSIKVNVVGEKGNFIFGHRDVGDLMCAKLFKQNVYVEGRSVVVRSLFYSTTFV